MVGAISFTNVDQSTPLDLPAQTNNGYGDSPNVNVTSESGDLVLDAMTSEAAGEPTSDHDEQYNVSYGINIFTIDYGEHFTSHNIQIKPHRRQINTFFLT